MKIRKCSFSEATPPLLGNMVTAKAWDEKQQREQSKAKEMNRSIGMGTQYHLRSNARYVLSHTTNGNLNKKKHTHTIRTKEPYHKSLSGHNLAKHPSILVKPLEINQSNLDDSNGLFFAICYFGFSGCCSMLLCFLLFLLLSIFRLLLDWKRWLVLHLEVTNVYRMHDHESMNAFVFSCPFLCVNTELAKICDGQK